MSPVAQNIKVAMAAKGITVEALARDLDLSIRVVQKWRQGTIRPRYENLVRLAARLDQEPSWFYEDHGAATKAAA